MFSRSADDAPTAVMMCSRESPVRSQHTGGMLLRRVLPLAVDGSPGRRPREAAGVLRRRRRRPVNDRRVAVQGARGTLPDDGNWTMGVVIGHRGGGHFMLQMLLRQP
ncbi:unnamed protein product [Vitrella brassicaformis CCMP3155]|uniref:Uncharacterized protein n=1 Tax=Vitrella brassicaformis (strain CCMP3155) TaxID=1169540 RepID=A0A0G4FND6_VITBC|nr:unnamed protein product [Vitrella brassicaformis CCMP3155]|eukprot:CEM15716.1 unnamed protein product [Vitrella brassicaformis CCMP3155]